MKKQKFLKWISAFGMIMLLMVVLAQPGFGAKAEANNTFDNLNQDEIVKEMGAGWNLGNQLEASITDGTQGETVWGNPVITKQALNAVKAAGFNTVRIPVSWMRKIGPAPSYTIDKQWMDRVQEVVDYAIANDMYVLIDLHNDGSISVDGSWIHTNATDQNAIKVKFGAVWKQIATRFKDYDEHLIFESMNEVGAESSNSLDEIKGSIKLINEYNQIFVDAVRQAGGNNNMRWLLVPGWITNIDYTAGDFGFEMPTDNYRSSTIPSSQKRLMVSVHYYSPWEFAGQEDGVVTRWGADQNGTITWANEEYMDSQFKDMYNSFASKGYPIVIGEYGSIDKSSLDSGNLSSRIYYANSVCKYSKMYGCVPVYWDNGNNGSYGFALFNRHNNYSVTQPGILSAMMHYYGSATSTQISLDQSSIQMELGDDAKALKATLSPANTYEWIEFSSSNPSVATVDRYGNVTTKGIGTAVIKASTNGNSASCNVTVKAPAACRVKFYMQNSHNWLTKSSDAFVSISKDGTYTISITGSREELSNVTLLYLEDLATSLGATDTSVIKTATVKLNSVQFNGTACTLTNNTISYSNSEGGLHIGLINVWGGNNIGNVSTNGSSDGVKFNNVTYQDTNTIKVSFSLSNVVMEEGGSTGKETVIYEGTTGSYDTADASWLMNAKDSDIITITYNCTDASQTNWGVLGWGGMVNNQWTNGPSYNADGDNAKNTKTATTTVGSLKSAMGITSGSSVSYLALSAYNSGQLLKLTLTSN